MQVAKKSMYDLNQLSECEAISVDESTLSVTVSNSKFKAVFSKTQGTLTNYTYDSTSMVSKPLLLNVFRLPTDNDGNQSGNWDTMGLSKLSVKCTGSEIQTSSDGKTVSVALNSVYTGQNGTSFSVMLDFIVCADGTMMVNSFISPSITGTIIPKIGFRLEMPSAME